MTPDPERAIFLGRRHLARGELAVAALGGGRWAAGITAGARAPSKHGNEDAGGALLLPGGRALAAVADAHWGDVASEAAVEAVLDPAGPAARFEGDLAASLERALRRASRAIAATTSPSETAVLAVAHEPGRIVWASVGDCLGWLVPAGRPEAARPFGTIEGVYLGRAPGWPAVETGEERVAPGDRLVLSTDGLVECSHCEEEVTPALLGRLAAGGTPEEAARALLGRILEHGNRHETAVVVGALE